MKKIFIILLCMITLNVNATEMCARNDTVVIPLDATVDGKIGGFSKIEWLWWITYGYGTVYGSATCLSRKEISMYSDWNGSGNLPGGLLLGTSSDELVGLSGYYMNADINPDIPDSEKSDYNRSYCFCKLTHPMNSTWILGLNICSECYNLCAQVLSTHHYALGLRTVLFNSIGTVPPWTE
ncbi:MAG: hypothetical protein R8N24_03010 [Alphaproteobacteria bacterium]|nr:hypothetical protein [Alphaproteobacteria bacterium]